MKRMRDCIYALTEKQPPTQVPELRGSGVAPGLSLAKGVAVRPRRLGESGGTVLKTQSTRTRLLASSMICGAAVLASGQAFAQDNGSNVEEFVVTGSRIPRPNLPSTS